MAIRVPLSERTVAPQESPAISVPQLTAPPPSAFGTDLARSTVQTGNIVTDLGTKLGEHMIERERQRQKAQVIQADTDFRIHLQNAMADPTPDPDNNNLPKGVFMRQGVNAHGATQDFDEQFMGLRDKYIQSMDTPYQKQALGELMDQNYPRIRERVAVHEGDQVRQGQNKILQDNLDTRVANAGNYANDPAGLINEIHAGVQFQHDNAMDNGVGTDGLPRSANKFSKDMVTNAIDPLIGTTPDKALAYLDQVKGAISPAVYNQMKVDIQEKARIRDGLQKYFDKKNDQAQDDTTNQTEAGIAGKMANGEITAADLDGIKGHVSDPFFHAISTALKNVGQPSGETPQAQTNAAVALQKQFISVPLEDSEKRTKAMMKFRSDVLASQPKLNPDDFNHLLGLSDPNFVAKIKPEKASALQAAWSFIKDHYDKYVPDGNPVHAIQDVINKSAGDSIKAEDVPTLAQAAVRSDTLKANPSLVGQADLANNITDAKGGIKQVYGQPTNLKPDQKITHLVKPPYGPEVVRGGKTYEWSSVDNHYHPKASNGR